MYYIRHQRLWSATHEVCASRAKSGKGKKTPTTELSIMFLSKIFSTENDKSQGLKFSGFEFHWRSATIQPRSFLDTPKCFLSHRHRSFRMFLFLKLQTTEPWLEPSSTKEVGENMVDTLNADHQNSRFLVRFTIVIRWMIQSGIILCICVFIATFTETVFLFQ